MKEINLTRKDKLINAAIDEFIENSFDEASLNNILKKAEISKGSFYYHFKNKQELYLYIFDQAVKDKITYFNKILNEMVIDYSKENVFKIFKLLGKVSLKFAAEYPNYYKLTMRIFEEKNEDIRALVLQKSKNNDNFQMVDTLIENAINNNELRGDFSPEFTTKVLKHLLTNFPTIVLDNTYEFDLEKVLVLYDNYLDFIENGLGRRA